MLQLFFTGFSTKNITKMLRRISRTHRKKIQEFCEENWTCEGANSKKPVEHARYRGVHSKNVCRHGNWA
jgi:hypothetical protein